MARYLMEKFFGKFSVEKVFVFDVWRMMLKVFEYVGLKLYISVMLSVFLRVELVGKLSILCFM